MSYAARGPSLLGIDANANVAGPRWLGASSSRERYVKGAP